MPVYTANERFVRGELRVDLSNGKKIYETCFRIAVGITKNRADAEDLVMSGYERAIERADVYNRNYELSTWLRIIVKNLAIDFMKRKQRRAELYFGELQNYTNVLEESPIDLAIKEEDRRTVEEALNRLPLENKRVLAMKYFEGMSYKEIAELTECKETTVKGRIEAGKKHLMRSGKLLELVA